MNFNLYYSILLTFSTFFFNQIACDFNYKYDNPSFYKQKLNYDSFEKNPKLLFLSKNWPNEFYGDYFTFETQKRFDPQQKRFKNDNSVYDTKINKYKDEMLPKPLRKSDDPQIFRNLFLGSRG